jgi:phosphoglycerate dehydrogenase-like enzyme
LFDTSRREIVDTGALIDAIPANVIRAGLDVFKDKPAVAAFAASELARMLCSATSHIGGLTAQASHAVERNTECAAVGEHP